MSVHAPPGSLAAFRYATRSALWVGRRPFLASPKVWGALCIALLGSAATVFALRPDFYYLAIVLGLLALGCAALLISWQRMRKSHGRPVVFVSLFDVDTEPEMTAAAAHQRALLRRIDGSFTGSSALDVRPLAVPLSAAAAARLLRVTEAMAVVHGRASALANHARWECELALPAAPFSDDYSITVTDKAVRPGRLKMSRRSARLVPDDEPGGPLVDAEFPLQQLVAEHATAAHFDGVVAALRLVIDERDVARDRPPSFDPMDISRAGLSETICGRLSVLNAVRRHKGGLEPGDNLDRLVEDLEDLESPSPWGWRFAGLTAFIGYFEGWADVKRLVIIATRRSELFPDDPTVWWDRAGAHVMASQWADAETAIDRASTLGLDQAMIDQQRGTVAYGRRQLADALILYRRADGRRGRMGARQPMRIADCLAGLGDLPGAIRQYRKAIRRDPFNRLAIEHAQRVSTAMGLDRAPSERLWGLIHSGGRTRRPRRFVGRVWLSHLLRRRGEYPSLHAWMGRTALLGSDLDSAIEWLRFSAGLDGDLDLQGVIDLGLTAALLGRTDEAAEIWDSLPPILAQAETTPQRRRELLEGIILVPLQLRPELRNLAAYPALQREIEKRFGVALPT